MLQLATLEEDYNDRWVVDLIEEARPLTGAQIMQNVKREI